MNQKEKVLYALACFTYVSRQALLSMFSSSIYGYRVLKELVDDGYARKITRAVRINGRKKSFTAIRITNKGLTALKKSFAATAGEERWIKYLPIEKSGEWRDRGINSDDLYAHVCHSSATMVSLMAGAAVYPIFFSETRKESKESQLTVERRGGRPMAQEATGEKPSPEMDETVDDGDGTSFADDMENIVTQAMTRSSPKQKLNGFVFNAKSDIVYYNSRYVKARLYETTSESTHDDYRLARIAGIIQSPLKSVVVYTGKKGGMSWGEWFIKKDLVTYRAFTARSARYKNRDGGNTEGILIVNSPQMFEKIYFDSAHRRKSEKEKFGARYKTMIIIPVSYEGAANLSDYMKQNIKTYEQTFAENAVASTLYEWNQDPTFKDIFPVREKKSGLPVFIGTFIDGNRLNRLNAVHGTHLFDYAVMCYDWQVEYYSRVISASQYITF